jgi:hypothetical protein
LGILCPSLNGAFRFIVNTRIVFRVTKFAS